MNCGKKELHFTVEGKPVPQGRPKFSKIGKKSIARDPSRSREYKALVKEKAEEEVSRMHWEKAHSEMPIRVTLHIYKGMPEGTPLWQKDAAKRGLIAPLKKTGDIENIAKGILDAMTGVVYEDDCQIYGLNCEARYSYENPRVEVYVEAFFTNVSDIKERLSEIRKQEKLTNV